MNTEKEQQEALQQIYDYAANLMFNEKKSERETRKQLVDNGVESKLANAIVNQVGEEKQKAANKDMIWGAIWCVGGIIATLSNLGYVFWGAIAFGGFQFFRGVVANNN
ncbi:MAG: hypothetical protein HC803_12100 [Saprospiraceae bacterium]|nr:hypothetical protein [Saprospiraceae bacterium]